MSTSHVDRDLSVDRPDRDQDKAFLRADKEQRRRIKEEKEKKEFGEGRQSEHYGGDLADGTQPGLPKRKSSYREDTSADQFQGKEESLADWNASVLPFGSVEGVAPNIFILFYFLYPLTKTFEHKQVSQILF